jgi:phage gpG-like protein
MTWDELGDYFNNLANNINNDIPDIIAETATEYYRERFSKKEFDGDPWERARIAKRTGSLLIESGALVNSIQPSYVGMDKVVISAGNEKVDYAEVHNEGFQGNVTIPAHTRRTKYGPVNVRSHSRNVNIPQRQFMGESKELASKMIVRIENKLRNLLKT